MNGNSIQAENIYRMSLFVVSNGSIFVIITTKRREQAEETKEWWKKKRTNNTEWLVLKPYWLNEFMNELNLKFPHRNLYSAVYVHAFKMDPMEKWNIEFAENLYCGQHRKTNCHSTIALQYKNNFVALFMTPPLSPHRPFPSSTPIESTIVDYLHVFQHAIVTTKENTIN